MLKHISTVVEEIDHRAAAKLLESLTFDPEYQRKYRPDHADFLARLIRTGQFLTGWVAEGRLGSERICAQGMHTLNAVVKAGRPIRCVREVYDCEMLADYAALFNAFDTDSLARSWPDSARAWAMGAGDDYLADAPHAWINLFRGAVEFAAKMGDGTPVRFKVKSRTERFDFITEFADEFKFCWELDGKRESSALFRRTPVMAAAINCFVVNPVAAEVFWRQSVSGFPDEKRHEYPPYGLTKYLREVTVINRSQKSLIKKADAPKIVYIKCLKYWNRWAIRRDMRMAIVGKDKRGRVVVPKIKDPEPYIYVQGIEATEPPQMEQVAETFGQRDRSRRRTASVAGR